MFGSLSLCFSVTHLVRIAKCFGYSLILHCLKFISNEFYDDLLFSVDFGVSAQLDKTMGRRNTFIGTPYWSVLQQHRLSLRYGLLLL